MRAFSRSRQLGERRRRSLRHQLRPPRRPPRRGPRSSALRGQRARRAPRAPAGARGSPPRWAARAASSPNAIRSRSPNCGGQLERRLERPLGAGRRVVAQDDASPIRPPPPERPRRRACGPAATSGSTISRLRPKNSSCPPRRQSSMSTTPSSRRPMPEHHRDRDPEQRAARVALVGLRVLDDRLDEQEAEDQPADHRSDADEEEVLHGLGQLAPVVDGAREAVQRVVEGDHQRQRRERVVDEVLRQREQHAEPDARPPRRSRSSRRAE